MEFNTPQNSNPLAKHFRQPAIYFKLPSNGAHWPNGSLNLPVTGELGVMSMTTRDEITLRTPDALMNGQGVVDVIQSCCPNIIDAWAMPSIDVDATLIAIRIASYGNDMEFKSTCPKCGEEHEYNVDLGVTLGSVKSPNYNKTLTYQDLIFKSKPQAYFDFNKNNMIAFEEQQIIRAIDSSEDPEVVKETFNLHLNKAIELNINLLTSSTEYIELDNESKLPNLHT